MQFIEGGICAAQGFKAGAAMAGIKYADKYDVAVIASEFEASIAGVFTTNLVQAAPVLYSKEVTARGKARAIVVNSGNANACTGEQGMTDCRDMAKVTGKLLGVDAATVAVASTGVIGVPLPMAKVAAGVTAAAADLVAGNGHLAATAIMTTDTVAKEVAVEFFLQGTPVRLGGMAKGSGMIHPNMATMLGFVTTDAVIDAELLQLSLQEAAATTFNMITVDGDTSTNDMLLVMANGQAGNDPILPGGIELAQFQAALKEVCLELAKMIARDGEGATKFLEITVSGAKSLEDARKAAKAIAGSNLVKAAFYGEDANWGRIICALGYSQAHFDPQLVDIYLGGLQVAKAGAGIAFSEAEAKLILQLRDIQVNIELHQGDCRATAWGCDLSHEYVTINGSYRT